MPAYAEVAGAIPNAREIAKLCSDLDNVMIDCHAAGWDGYGADAVSVEAYELAQRFIRSLPAGIPLPTISADSDGCVTFEWHVSPRRMLLVSVRPDYRIDFAGLFGGAEIYGTSPFFDRLPAGICDFVGRVYQA